MNRNGVIHSFPMKGTIEAGIPDAIKMLMEDEKKLPNTILCRSDPNDIGIVSENVK
ncbi:MAG: hypothetical protein IPF52_16425 [Saprospiraceae bacterium]|nr:hypothetical protein [Saprospiraceae bacterium]